MHFFFTTSQMRLSSRTLVFRFLLLQTFITTCHISATFQKSVAGPLGQLNVLWCRACKIYTFQHFGQCTGRSSKRKNWRGIGPIWVGLEHFTLKDSSPLHWLQLWHQLSNRWSDFATGWQLKGGITVRLSNLQNAYLGQITCLFCFWKIKPWCMCFSSSKLTPHLFYSCNFGLWGWEKIKCIRCLFLEASLGLEVHFLENVETFISKSCWQWSFHCSMPDF